jgi:hypothetical protein
MQRRRTMSKEYKGSSDPEIRELARVTCEELEDRNESDLPVLSGNVDPPLGSWAATARMMAGPNPTKEEAEFWNRWKDEMKEGDY